MRIKADPQSNAIVIPAEAVIRSGDRTQVFIVRGPGKFEPRIVTLGFESDGLVSVLGGVEAGDEVVTSAQFMVDSESKLREATAKMMDVLKGPETSSAEGSKSMENHEGMERSSENMIDHSQMQMDGRSGMETEGQTNSSMQGAHNHD